MRAAMDRKTAARRYVRTGELPSMLAQGRDWRTRPAPFTEHWSELAARLKEAPELEPKTLSEDLLQRRPGRCGPGLLRTLQRRAVSGRRRRAGEGGLLRAGAPGCGDANGPHVPDGAARDNHPRRGAPAHAVPLHAAVLELGLGGDPAQRAWSGRFRLRRAPEHAQSTQALHTDSRLPVARRHTRTSLPPPLRHVREQSLSVVCRHRPWDDVLWRRRFESPIRCTFAAFRVLASTCFPSTS